MVMKQIVCQIYCHSDSCEFVYFYLLEQYMRQRLGTSFIWSNRQLKGTGRDIV